MVSFALFKLNMKRLNEWVANGWVDGRINNIGVYLVLILFQRKDCVSKLDFCLYKIEISFLEAKCLIPHALNQDGA